MKNDSNVIKLKRETLFNIIYDQCESNGIREFIPEFKDNLIQ